MKKIICLLTTGVFLLFTECSKDPLDFAPDLPAEKSGVSIEVLSPEVEEAVQSGIDWLLTTQNPDGNFGGYSDGVARTALAVTKLCDRSIELGATPMDGPYTTVIVMGLNYIFNNAVSNPEGGKYLSTTFNHSVYNTGIAMMAIAAATCPDCAVEVPGSIVDGFTFAQVLQETVDFFVAAQNPDGGWRYYDHSQPSDNSNTGFAVLGLLAAEGAGSAIPQLLKDNLSVYIDFIQTDGDGPDGGGSGYTAPNSWVNTLKTGNLLFEMAFVGDDASSPRVLHALEYLDKHWNDNNADPGWRNNNFLAMYCLMKGFVSMGIDELLVDGIPVNWYDEFVAEILAAPHWPLPNGNWTDPYLSSIFGMLTLEKITPIPIILVNVDVKPTSCPNPLNRGSKGVLPVAILGTADFDVTTIDPASVNIGGAYALNWSVEDVSTPYDGEFSDPLSKVDCTTEGPDGYTDLVLKFNTTEVAALFPDLNKDDVFIIHLEGSLLDGGPTIIGEDVMIIVK